MKVATHSGSFHADDVFATATLGLALGPLEVVRTRDESLHAAADLRVDVGGRSDPATGDFDHHQKGGAGVRPNGIRYASFGLVWRAYGEQLAGGREAAESIDQRLVQGVDANDTGQTISQSIFGDVRPMTVSGVIAAMNPVWDEDVDQAGEDALFDAAVAVATRILEREIAGSAAFRRARQLVEDAIGRAGDPRVIELDRDMPWREAVVNGAPDALFVMYPKSDGWGLQAVPATLGAFANRKNLPTAWAGLSGAELAAVTGVEDAVFAHAAGFYASARTRDGIAALAQQALAADGR